MRLGRRSLMSGALGLALAAGLLVPVVTVSDEAQASSLWQPLSPLVDASSVGFEGPVVAAAAGSDDTVYIGGDFEYAGLVTGPGAVTVSTSSSGASSIVSQAPQFAAPGYWGPSVDAAISDGSGGWFVGGTFESVGGYERRNLVRLSSPTTVADGWAPAFNGAVKALALRPASGDLPAVLFVGGEFTSVSLGGATSTRARLAAFDVATGSLLPWAPAAANTVRALAASGSTVYVGGEFTSVTPSGGASIPRFRIAAVAADDTGSILPWAPEMGAQVNAISVVQSNVLVAGNFTSVTPVGGATVTRGRLAALAADDTGTLLSWAPSVNQTVASLAVLDDTTMYPGSRVVLAGGGFTSITPAGGASTSRGRVAAVALDDTGTLLPWAPNFPGTVSALAIARSGAGQDCPSGGSRCVFVGGDFLTVTPAGGSPQSRIRTAAVALDDTGTLLPWSPGATSPLNPAVNTVAVGDGSAGNRVFVGGSFVLAGLEARLRLAAVDSSGRLTSWSPRAGGVVRALAVSNDQVYVGGDFSSVTDAVGTTASRSKAASFSTAGVLSSWNPNVVGGNVYALAVDDTRVYVGGNFSQIDSVGRRYLAAVNKSTGGFVTWGPTVNDSSRAVFTMALSQGKLHFGGNFTSVTQGVSQMRNRAAAVLTDDTGTLTGWNPSAPGGSGTAVSSISLADGTAFLAGNFTQVGGQSRKYVARVATEDTGSLLPWRATPDGSAVNGAVLSGDRVILGGVFSNMSAGVGPSEIRDYAASVDDSGSGSLLPALNANNEVRFVTLAGRQLVLGGSDVRNLGGVSTSNIAFGPTRPSTVNGQSGDGSVSLSWTPTWSGTFPVQGYAIDSSTDGGVTWQIRVSDTGSSQASATISGLVNGTPYTFRVSAITRLGMSAPSVGSAAITPQAPPPPPPPPVFPPSAPVSVTAVAGDSRASVTWSPPTNAGSFPVSSYQVTATPGGRSCLTAALTCEVTGLTNGTSYIFTVKALNGAGWSSASAASNAVTPQTPPQPVPVSLMITGSRDGRLIAVSGSSVGLASGDQVTPWIRVGAGRVAVPGRPVMTDADGSFEWSRRVRDVRRVWVHVTFGDVKSNSVLLRR